MTEDETQIQITLGFLDSCTEPRTGFLTPRTPGADLGSPFGNVSRCVAELKEQYHHREMNCRAWLEERFAQVDPQWEGALKEAEPALLESAMTQVSLLCHAYLCGNAYADSPVGTSALPLGLDWLWREVAERMELPRVGNFHALVATNWRLEGVGPAGEYQLASLTEEKIRPLHSFLVPPLQEEWSEVVKLALVIEAKGARLLEATRELLGCVLRRNSQEATYHMMVLSAGILSLSSTFNRSYRRRKATAAASVDVVRPTLILGGEEGASSLQSPTFQLLESLFGLNPETEWGRTLVEARRYMPPPHRRLLKVLDATSPVIRSFVETAGSPRLLETYNRCLVHLKTWRLLYQKRGRLLTRAEQEVGVESQARPLEGDWKGKEWSLDFLFRFLTDEQRALLARNTETIRYRAGEVIIQQGNLFPGLFVLKSGSASVRKKVGQEEEVVDTMGVEEVFGEMSLVENLPASASIVADVDLEAQQVSLETVYDLINEHRDAEGGFYLALAQLISHRLRKAFPVGRPA